jgi:hypothetical protein
MTDARAETDSKTFDLAARHWSIAGVVVCCAVTIGLRIPSLGWGLPYLFHPDEPTNFSIVQRMLKQHALNPHFFKYPSLFFYLNAVVEVGHYWVCRALGIVHSVNDLPELDVPIDGSGFTTLPSAFVVARCLSVICAVGTVCVAYQIGCTLSDKRRTGLLAALLVTVSAGVLRDSRWMAPDAMVMFAATATVLASLWVLRFGRARDYILAAALAGLTASLKYNGGLVGVTVCAAGLLRDGRRAFRNPWLYAAPAIALASFLLTSPFIVLNFDGFWKDFMSERAHYATGHDGAEGDTLAFYWDYLLEWDGVGALLAVGGGALAIVRRDAGVAVLGAFGVCYFCFINLFVTRNGQTIVPMIPTLLCVAAWFASECFGFLTAWLQRRHAARFVSVCSGVALAALLGSYPLLKSVKRTRPLLLKDNRELASQWIGEHVPEHARFAVERYGCYISRKRYGLKATRNLIGLEPAWLREHIDYLVFAGDSFNRYLVDPGRYRRQAAKYRQLFRDFELVKAFDNPNHGAEIRIYRARPSAPFVPGRG